jgi:uncharacterized protein YpmB
MIALYIIVVWIVIAIILVTKFYYNKEMKMTSPATGSVISAVNQEIFVKGARRDVTVVTCEFVVGERKYQVARGFPGRNAERYPPGRKLPVRYNPSDPSMAMIPVR